MNQKQADREKFSEYLEEACEGLKHWEFGFEDHPVLHQLAAQAGAVVLREIYTGMADAFSFAEVAGDDVEVWKMAEGIDNITVSVSLTEAIEGLCRPNEVDTEDRYQAARILRRLADKLEAVH